MTERVNHPQHYQSDAQCSDCGKSIECIDVVQHENFNRGNAIKYIWRAGKKEGTVEAEDLLKAIWYLQNEVRRLLQNAPLTEDALDASVGDAAYEEYLRDPSGAAPLEPPQPEWSSAPAWAQWWAVDYGGNAYWYELEPEANKSFGYWSHDGDCKVDSAGVAELGSVFWGSSKRGRGNVL
jgi:hypothetical protein